MSETVAFYILAGVVLASAWNVVRNPNLFHAGLALIVCFVAVGGLYINLDAPFLGAMQVLIYAGAIAVLLLFGFMLTHDIMRPHSERSQKVGGAVTAVTLAAVLLTTIAHTQWYPAGKGPVSFSVNSLALSYMTEYLLPFEVVALLLLASLIGAIVIARKEESGRA